MDTRKLSFRLLLVLTCAVWILLLVVACGDGNHEENYSECEYNNMPERRAEVMQKYEDLFWRQPNFHELDHGHFTDENAKWMGVEGIIITVTEKMDQSRLPSEDRIPDCLEGIPIQIIEGFIAEKEEPQMRANRYTLPECINNNTEERTKEILGKYSPRLWKYPNVQYIVTSPSFRDENGSLLPRYEEMAGIIVAIMPWVDPDSVPPELRIPDCLEGIPIQIVEGKLIF